RVRNVTFTQHLTKTLNFSLLPLNKLQIDRRDCFHCVDKQFIGLSVRHCLPPVSDRQNRTHTFSPSSTTYSGYEDGHIEHPPETMAGTRRFLLVRKKRSPQN